MTNSKTTRKALVLSLLSLLLCCSMLVGTTFAWFTDSVTSGNNKIVAGNLDVELYYKLDVNDTEWKKVSAETELFDDDVLWEPGFTQVVYLKVVNEGTLALKYQIGMNIVDETKGVNVAGKEFSLSDYIMFGTDEADAESEFAADRDAARAAINGKPIRNQYNAPVWNTGDLLAGETALLTMVAYMPETVGNEANYRDFRPHIQLGLSLVAAQKTHENDSFDELYDENATYRHLGYGSGILAEGDVAHEVYVRNTVTNAKMGSVLINRASVAEAGKLNEVFVDAQPLDERITVADGEEAVTYNIQVTNLVAGNTTNMKVQLRIGTELSNVKLYVDGQEQNASYDPSTGYAIFETAAVGAVTAVYTKGYTPGTSTAPTIAATVTDVSAEHANKTINWAGYSGWTPSDPNQTLACAYLFKAPHDGDTVDECEYKDWECDFYVSINNLKGGATMLPENTLFLGGNYGDFGWVGFEAPEAPANTEIPILGTVAGNGWTYESIASFVNEFLCGVAPYSQANAEDLALLEGATFTVKLCLTDPVTGTRYTVNQVDYIFPAN